MTLRWHLEQAARHSPVARTRLAGPDLPEESEHLWGWFCELNAARASGVTGMGPITYSEIESWARLTRRRPRALDVNWLKALDALWRAGPPRDDADR